MKEIKRWINQLGSLDEKTRQSAFKYLKLYYREANQQIRAGLFTDNPRIRHGCFHLLYSLKVADILNILMLLQYDKNEKIAETARTYLKVVQPLSSKKKPSAQTQSKPSRTVNNSKEFTQQIHRKKTSSSNSASRQKKQASNAKPAEKDKNLGKNYHIFPDSPTSGYRPRSRENTTFENLSVGAEKSMCRFCYEWFPKREIGSHQVDCIMNPLA